MALREEVHNRIETLSKDPTFYFLATHPVIFHENVHAIEEIYSYLIIPNAILTFDTLQRILWLETDENHKIKLSVDEKTLTKLVAIFKEKKVKIGYVGPFSIYFDPASESKIFIDTRIARVMGDPIQLNLHLYPDSLEVINWLENIGYIHSSDTLIVNRGNKVITLFLQNGSEMVADVDHKYYPTLLALSENKRIEIGTELSDTVFYTASTSFFHRSSDGSAISPADLEREVVVDRKITELEVIQVVSYYTSARIMDKHSEHPDLLFKNGQQQMLITSTHPNYEIFYKIVTKKHIQVGRMGGEDKVMFSLQSGFMIMRLKRVNHIDFNRVKEHYPALLQSANGMKLFRDEKNKNCITTVSPGGKTEIIKNSHLLFPFYTKLLNGLIAYTRLPINDEEKTYLISYTESGLTIHLVSEEELQKRMKRGEQRFFKMDLQPAFSGTETNEASEEKIKTKKRKRTPEPVKMFRGKQRYM